MGAIVGQQGVVQGYYAGPPDTCDYKSADGRPIAAMVLVDAGQGAGVTFDAIKADPNSEEFPGIGDRALYNSQMTSFLVQKGDALVTIVVTADLDEAARVEAAKAIAAKAAGRM